MYNGPINCNMVASSGQSFEAAVFGELTKDDDEWRFILTTVCKFS